MLGGGPRGPARATTACRRCAAARGITQPVPVHQLAHETVCTRHAIWLSPPGLPQLDVSACPEIITAQHRARRLLRRCTPEQLIHAQVQAATLAASGRPPGQEPSAQREQRARYQKPQPRPALSRGSRTDPRSQIPRHHRPHSQDHHAGTRQVITPDAALARPANRRPRDLPRPGSDGGAASKWGFRRE